MLRHGDEENVVAWLDSLGYSRGEEIRHYGNGEMSILNRALQEVIEHNKLNIAVLLLDYGASTFK